MSLDRSGNTVPSWISRLLGGRKVGADSQPLSTPSELPTPGDATVPHCTVETDTWRLTFPAEWVAKLDQRPWQVLGPGEVTVTISPAFVSGGEFGPHLDALVDEVEGNAIRSIADTQAHFGLLIDSALIRDISPNGTVVHSTEAHEESTGYFMAQYCLRRGRTIVVVTHEGPAHARDSVNLVATVLRGISWQA
jgi:hypothetical protein